MTSNEMYARYTETLYDLLLEQPNFLDNLTLETTEQTNTFKEVFRGVYDIYEIGGETLLQFKTFIENTFNVEKQYYQQLINAYYENIDYLEGVENTSENIFYELPNKLATLEYPTNKNKSTSKGGYTKIQLKNMYIQQLRNVYLEFVNKFKTCFILIYS